MRRLLASVFCLMATLPSIDSQAQELLGDERGIELTRLTESKIEAFLALYPELMRVMSDSFEIAMEENVDVNDSSAVTMSALEDLAVRHGFRNFDDQVRVENTIGLYFIAIDPVTREFMDPRKEIDLRLDQIRQDATLSEKTRAQVRDVYLELLTTQPRLDDPQNVALVKAYYDKIVLALQE